MPKKVSDTATMTTKVHAIVRGEVQGVGFRWFVQKTGVNMHLAGWVKNRIDGSVEIEAEGKQETLERFLTSIRNDHPWAHVESIETEWTPGTENMYEQFDIL